MPRGEGAGRPTKYQASFCKIAQAMMKLGATDREVAAALSISEETLNVWKHTRPKFSESLKVGKSASDRRVELSLYKKATGYSYTVIKKIVVGDAIVDVETTEHVPPSDRAIEYWLNNRKRKQWQNRTHNELSGPKGGPIQQTYVPASIELLQDYYAKIAQDAAAVDPHPEPARLVGPARSEGDEPGDGEGFSPR